MQNKSLSAKMHFSFHLAPNSFRQNQCINNWNGGGGIFSKDADYYELTRCLCWSQVKNSSIWAQILMLSDVDKI